MEQTLRRAGTTIGVGLYVVWILGVVTLIITQLTHGPVPGIVNLVVVAGTVIGIGLGIVLILYRFPEYVRRLREPLSG